MDNITGRVDTSGLNALLEEIPANFLKGRRILITGAARGLGLAFSKVIAKAGASVVIADVLAELAATEAHVLREQGCDVHALPLDLSDPASIDRCVADAIALLGGLDGLVNNAAITNSGGKDAHALQIDTWDQVMNVNVRGVWLMSRACRTALKDSGRGAIVNLASDTALWGAQNLLAYVTSKGALIAMTRSLAREWGADGITVNSVAPGLTLVEATEYVPKVRHEKYLEGRALPREQQADDVCGAVVFALSGLSRFLTGQLIAVNGGFVLH